MDVKPQHKRQWQLYLDFIETSRNLTHEPDTNLAKHHIIPRHLGGTDDAENLIALTYLDHAQAHRLLYETFGMAPDHAAWRRWEVAAQDEQAFLDGCSKGGQIGGKIAGRINVDSGQIFTIATPESCSNGGKNSNGGKASVASHGPQLANGGKATVESHGPQMANGGKIAGRKAVKSGQLASVRSKGLSACHAKWISLFDGCITAFNCISRKNKQEPARIGTWVEL
jgi:hypothetical protein